MRDRSALLDVVTAARSGDLDALATLVDEFTPTALATAWGLCGDWHTAEDIAQEAFAIVVARIGELREPAAFPGWLAAIVRTAASRHARRRIPIAVGGTDRPDAFAASTESTDALPDEVVVRADEARRVRLAVEALKPELRLPVVLHYFAGCSVAQIADLCDVPVSTVKQRMRVARARVREGIDGVNEDMLCGLAPDVSEDRTDVIRLYTAMRAGDTRRVATLLDEHPELVDVREDWNREDSFAHRLAFTEGGGTPLLRAIERGDETMVGLFLEYGADPNGRCTCPGAEPPLWTAVTHRRVAVARELLARGADPNASAFRGVTPMHVAAMRGYDELTELLRAHGASADARDDEGHTARDWTVQRSSGAVAPADELADVAALVTGIKTVDLWCPLPSRGLVRWTAVPGVGSTVLLTELAHRFATTGHTVVWTGFVQTPLDAGDFAHGLAEMGVADLVTLCLASPDADLETQRAVFARGHALAAAAPRTLLVVFEDVGRAVDIETHLPELASAVPGPTIVVAPLAGDPVAPEPAGTPYAASVAFDARRAARGQFPAIGPDGSWSKVLDAEGGSLAARARRVLAQHDERGAWLNDYLAQPFFTAEPFIGRPGEFVELDQLRTDVGAIIE